MKLKPGFKYLEEGVYSYEYPSWTDSTGKVHYMMSQHSLPLTVEECEDPLVVKEFRVHTAKEAREIRQLIDGSDLVVVMFENWEADKTGLNYAAALDPDSAWYKKVYNATRYFLMDREQFEKDVWM